ncbi:MAG: FHA domain-containing protein [Oscillospiraceae bacterium]|nr:FHA domain-containing protein [Oscillospiraceae bacterium]MCL2278876.1 FHA domain-containing protein [Oscillospiraceae bacterium]
MSMVDYKIESKSDFASGAYLIAKILQNKVDKNALYTIGAESPKFILPFTYKNIDGEMEIVYEVGNLSKLTYFQGELSGDEYVELWESLLEPLLDCGDWFLTPDSFVLSTDYLYYDKKKKSVVYVYIPSVECLSDKNSFNSMAVALSKIITVSDTGLENKMLRSILENSSPREFLDMLKEHSLQRKVPTAEIFAADAEKRAITNDEDRTLNRSGASDTSTSKEFIDFDSVPEEAEDTSVGRVKKEQGRFKLFGTKSKKKKEQKSSSKPKPTPEISDDFTLQENYFPKPSENFTAEPQQAQTTITEITESIPIVLQKVSLRCMGKAELPQRIGVAIREGDIFSIGRYDAAVRRPQSSFEFDKKTKAVSRRHAVIERDCEGYKIIDLSSRAGTFVDGQKLPPNTPYKLDVGTKVSFGNFGVDYVWDVSYHASPDNR